MKKICIDCGYGINEEIFKRANLMEGSSNIIMAKKVGEKLTGLGFIVHMTRNRNEYIPLSERLKRIKNSGAEASITIDTNWSENSNQKGIETYYGDGSKSGELLAKKIQKELTMSTHLYNRGFLCSSSKNPEGIYLLTNCMMTSVITLLGFYSNPYERELYLKEEFKEAASAALVRGICKYFDIKIKPLKTAK